MVLKQRHLHSDPRTHAFTRTPISQEERVELLAHVSLFSGLSQRELRQLAGEPAIAMKLLDVFVQRLQATESTATS